MWEQSSCENESSHHIAVYNFCALVVIFTFNYLFAWSIYLQTSLPPFKQCWCDQILGHWIFNTMVLICPHLNIAWSGAEKIWYRGKHKFVKLAGSFSVKQDFLQNFIHARIYLSTYFWSRNVWIKTNWCGRSINSQKEYTETSSKSILRIVERQRWITICKSKIGFIQESRIYDVEEFPNTCRWMDRYNLLYRLYYPMSRIWLSPCSLNLDIFLLEFIVSSYKI